MEIAVSPGVSTAPTAVYVLSHLTCTRTSFPIHTRDGRAKIDSSDGTGGITGPRTDTVQQVRQPPAAARGDIVNGRPLNIVRWNTMPGKHLYLRLHWTMVYDIRSAST